MKSKASFKSHPLHPILVSFPIAFFTGTVLFHVIGWLLEKPGLMSVAYYLNIAGVGFGLLAAIPGIIDYTYTVPPKSSGKKRAALHGLTNTVMLLVFLGAFIYRRNAEASQSILLLLEGIGLLLLGIAGWMGGTLVYRNQIGVDHRYANAGKWNEARFDTDSGTIEVATINELKINAMKLLHFKNKRIVLGRTEDNYLAFDDRCPHKGGSLADGCLAGGLVQCPWHGSQFSCSDGSLKAGPSKKGISVYPVKVDGEKVFITI